MLIDAFKFLRYLFRLVRGYIDFFYAKVLFIGNGVEFSVFQTVGVPFVSVARGASCVIGSGFSMNNRTEGNPIGRVHKCIIFVDQGARVVIGENVGISSAALVAHNEIIIENDVKIGGGVCVYDTDFHALDADVRNDSIKDRQNKVTKPVRICKGAFVGAHSTILKGVTIGENAVIGACSVVTKNVPAGEVWAGNPAKNINQRL